MQRIIALGEGKISYIIAIGIPAILILSGALSKKLVRGTSWTRSDFFLGVELSLTAMGSSLIFIYEVSRTNDVTLIQDKALISGLFTLVCFFLLLWVMAVHQDWEKRPQNRGGQLLWLGGFCNFIGIGLMASFVLFVKGVST